MYNTVAVVSALLLLPLASSVTHSVCPDLNNEEIKYFDIRIDQTNVPSQLTTYICQKIKIPVDLEEQYHAVAFQPLIFTPSVVHHMIMFGCPGDQSDSTDPLKREHQCTGADNQCRTFLMQWSMGIKGHICSPPEAGFKFGHDSIQAMSLQIHWNNANYTQGLSDNSGVRVYYTKKLRKYDLGNVQVGQNDLEIPPYQGRYSQFGGCSSECTKAWLTEPIFLTRAHIHMHYTGDGGILEIVRKNEDVETVFLDSHYDYTSPPAHYMVPAIQVNPGDFIKLTCFFNTRDGKKRRNQTVYWGEGSDGEMCYAFISYYPQIQNFDQCIQFDRFDICSINGMNSLGGCFMSEFLRQFTQKLSKNILANCPASKLCENQCFGAIHEMTGHPCMQGRLAQQARRVYLPMSENWLNVSQIIYSANVMCLDK